MNLLASGVWQTIGSVALAILVLLAMITVHEFGHYVVGKILKFKITEFSIGFGPAIFKRVSKKTGEIFAIRLIPLGGYCAFDGEDGDESTLEKPQADAPFQDFQEQTEKEITETELAQQTPTPKGALFNDQAPWKRILVLVAGAFMNYLLALLIIVINVGVFGQNFYRVDNVAQDSEYSQEQSLADGDILTSINGTDLYVITDFASCINGKKKGDVVKAKVIRDGELIEIDVKLREDCTIPSSQHASKIWRSLGVDVKTENDGQKYYALSVTTLKFGFFETIGRSFVSSFKIGGAIFTTLGELLTGKLALTSMGGPITTIQMTSEIAQNGLHDFLEICAYIGVNLAVFNLLPVPALDGSKVIFCAIEWICKKPVPRKIEAIIHAVGILLLFGFAILVDILHFI